jgi:hypothetical protein
MNRPAVPEVPTVADPNTYIEGRSFDWHCYRYQDGERVFGAVGAAGRLDTAMQRVAEELTEYVTAAYAVIKVTFHSHFEPEQQVVVKAVRDINGEVSWSFPQ